MAFQAVPSGAKATVRATLDGQDCLTTLGFKKVSPGVILYSELAVLALALAGNWVLDEFSTQLPAEWIFQRVDVQALDVLNGPQAEDSSTSGTTGTVTGPIMPNSTTLAISFRTGVGGRANRGRNYWPSFIEDDIVKQRVSAPKIAAIIAVYTALIGEGTFAPGWQWAVISRKPLIINGPGRAVPIVSVSVRDDIVDSQRRRLPGRGN
jgi:hypothetical protein